MFINRSTKHILLIAIVDLMHKSYHQQYTAQQKQQR